MAWRAIALLVALGALACSSAEELPADSGPAPMLDASAAPDAGSTVCGADLCSAEEYCRVDPVGACMPLLNPDGGDSGNCADPNTEPCESNGVPGCTEIQARGCHLLPAACVVAPSCGCLIASAACPGAVNFDCRRPSGMGFTVECPFP